jgi:hypothetical protein
MTRDQYQVNRLGQLMLMSPEGFPQQTSRPVSDNGAPDFPACDYSQPAS